MALYDTTTHEVIEIVRGNLSHIHMLLEADWKKLTHIHKDFILDLVRASVLEVVRSNEVDELIRDGTFKCVEDYKEMINDAITFLPHKCTSGCQAKVVENGEVKFKCRKLNNLKVRVEQGGVWVRLLICCLPNRATIRR